MVTASAANCIFIQFRKSDDNMDARVTELHCIMPIANIPSVLAHGILSHDGAAKLRHRSVAMDAVQDKRSRKVVPGGRRLHHYANLYFHARNPLRVSTSVLAGPGTVVTDQNAASDYVRFGTPARCEALDFDDIYARDWRHPDDQLREWRHKSRKCAEVLVPSSVAASDLIGALVADPGAAARLSDAGFMLPITIDPDFFFR
jgi:ssDNA thymidine ADP-ribosyltransferase, DarT